MKKIFKILSLLIVLFLVACGKNTGDVKITEEDMQGNEAVYYDENMEESSDNDAIDPDSIFDEDIEEDKEDTQEPSAKEESLEVEAFDEVEDDKEEVSDRIKKDGNYTSKDDVAAYLRKYGELPKNYITKKDAGDLGWVASKGNLWEVTDNMSIGGDRFANREGLLPTKKGRTYYEADIDYEGGRRNAKRIVFSNDGLIFYTDDHYASFEDITEEE